VVRQCRAEKRGNLSPGYLLKVSIAKLEA